MAFPSTCCARPTTGLTTAQPLTRRHTFAGMVALSLAAAIDPRSAAAAPDGGPGAVASGKTRQSKRVFITGSSAGLGQMAARLLVAQGHRVVLHGRSPERAAEAMRDVPGAEAALYGDFLNLTQVRSLAEQASRSGPFDAVIHNAGIGEHQPRRIVTEDGVPHLFQINVLAPYVLTALMQRPRRLIYITSGMQLDADAKSSLGDLLWEHCTWDGPSAYSESKLLDTMLAFGIARLWPDVFSNSVEPGWVPTRMGGEGATDDLSQGHLTQVWLAVSNEPRATMSGEKYYHLALHDANPDASTAEFQDLLLAACERLSRVSLPS